MPYSYAEITGRGVVSSAAQSIDAFNRAILEGHCSIRAIPELTADLRFSMGAPITDFDARQHFDDRTLNGLDRFAQFAAVAARQAFAEAALTPDSVPGERIAVIIGSANGGFDIINDGYVRLYTENRKPRPLTVPMSMGSAPASRIAREIGARGPVFGVSSACASSAHAMMIGLSFIRSGLSDVAIVGGADSCFSKGYLLAWDALRVVSPDTARPFSLNRRGLVLGEGAGILVLEAPGRAAARGASVLGRLLGAGMSSDAGDLIVPQSDGMQRAMRLALGEAGMEAVAVDYINAHGTGTVANDRVEAHAIRQVFGAAADRLSVSSTKSIVGHAMGASGALEALATLAAIAAGIVPPTVNFIAPDPQCDLDVTPNAPKRRNIDLALSNSFAFGGLNVSLAFARAA
jgi:nodulation protein E